MSERDGDNLTVDRVGFILVMAVALIMVIIVMIDKKNVSEVRDLQRRVATLESERR